MTVSPDYEISSLAEGVKAVLIGPDGETLGYWRYGGQAGSGARRRRFFFGKSGRGSGLPADGRMYYDEGMKSSARLLLGICLFVKIAALAPQAEAVPACGTRLTNASAPARDALALPESREELGASEQSFESPLFSPVRGALQTGLKRFRKEPFRTALILSQVQCF
jgi:hypothetical protein